MFQIKPLEIIQAQSEMQKFRGGKYFMGKMEIENFVLNLQPFKYKIV